MSRNMEDVYESTLMQGLAMLTDVMTAVVGHLLVLHRTPHLTPHQDRRLTEIEQAVGCTCYLLVHFAENTVEVVEHPVRINANE